MFKLSEACDESQKSCTRDVFACVRTSVTDRVCRTGWTSAENMGNRSAFSPRGARTSINCKIPLHPRDANIAGATLIYDRSRIANIAPVAIQSRRNVSRSVQNRYAPCHADSGVSSYAEDSWLRDRKICRAH